MLNAPPETKRLPAIAEASVTIDFPPSMAAVDRIIRWLSELCYLSPGDLDVTSRMELAIYELVENTVKYGTDSKVSVKVSVEDTEAGKLLKLSTHNQAAPERLGSAVRILTDLRETADPIAYYDQLILESAPRQGMSGLGLARIRAEAELELDFAVEGNRLSITVAVLVEAKPSRSELPKQPTLSNHGLGEA